MKMNGFFLTFKLERIYMIYRMFSRFPDETGNLKYPKDPVNPVKKILLKTNPFLFYF